MEEEDKKYYWKKFQLQRAVDTLARVEIEYRGNKARGKSEDWDVKAITRIQE